MNERLRILLKSPACSVYLKNSVHASPTRLEKRVESQKFGYIFKPMAISPFICPIQFGSEMFLVKINSFYN